jgi:hypothetical protein
MASETPPLQPDPKEIARLDAESARLRDSVAAITFAWAAVENSMTLVLARVIKDPIGDLASAIFFAPSALETRLAIVNSAVREIIHFLSIKTDVEKPWSTIMNRLGRLKETRNKVAHGQQQTFISPRNRRHIRLMPPLYNVQAARSHPSRQIPGLSANDISGSARSVHKTVKSIDLFQEIVPLIHTREISSLQQRLVALEDSLQS